MCVYNNMTASVLGASTFHVAPLAESHVVIQQTYLSPALMWTYVTSSFNQSDRADRPTAACEIQYQQISRLLLP